jgi:hypothetical protein
MKKLITAVFIITCLIAPQVSLAIDFTPNDLASVVQIKSIMPKAAIDQQIRSLAGFYNDEELLNYRKQLEVQNQIGSGIMVTYSGCALTNKHVIFNSEVNVDHENIHLWSTNDLNKPPVDLGKAIVVWRMTLVDLAMVCLESAQGQYYPHVSLNPADFKDFKLNLGETIYNLGYPLGGEKESLTLTSGLVAGVWDKDFLKGDLTITGGASGSPIYNSQKQVISLASGNAGENGSYGIFLKPSYIYNWRKLYQTLYRELISDSAGCLDADQPRLYQKKDQQYYDLSCKNKRDAGLEAKIIAEYKQYCPTGQGLNNNELLEVAGYISSGKSTVNHWANYLEKSCLVLSLPITVFDGSAEK